jgi:hypothetical protein
MKQYSHAYWTGGLDGWTLRMSVLTLTKHDAVFFVKDLEFL